MNHFGTAATTAADQHLSQRQEPATLDFWVHCCIFLPIFLFSDPRWLLKWCLLGLIVVFVLITTTMLLSPLIEFGAQELSGFGGGVDASAYPLCLRRGHVHGRFVCTHSKENHLAMDTVSLDYFEPRQRNLRWLQLTCKPTQSAICWSCLLCRACYGVLRFVMESGAKGCEVIVSGKLRAQRAKSMKFKDGYMVSSGDPTRVYLDCAVRHVALRQGMLGIKVGRTASAAEQ